MTNFPINRYTNAERAQHTFMISSLPNLSTFIEKCLRSAIACIQIHSLEDLRNFTTIRSIIIIFRDHKPKITTQTNGTSYLIKDKIHIEYIKHKSNNNKTLRDIDVRPYQTKLQQQNKKIHVEGIQPIPACRHKPKKIIRINNRRGCNYVN